jgi:hypothetical protein
MIVGFSIVVPAKAGTQGQTLNSSFQVRRHFLIRFSRRIASDMVS